MENSNKCYFEIPPRNTESVSNDSAYKYIPDSVTENVKIFLYLVSGAIFNVQWGSVVQQKCCCTALSGI